MVLIRNMYLQGKKETILLLYEWVLEIGIRLPEREY